MLLPMSQKPINASFFFIAFKVNTYSLQCKQIVIIKIKSLVLGDKDVCKCDKARFIDRCR